MLGPRIAVELSRPVGLGHLVWVRQEHAQLLEMFQYVEQLVRPLYSPEPSFTQTFDQQLSPVLCFDTYHVTYVAFDSLLGAPLSSCRCRWLPRDIAEENLLSVAVGYTGSR
eukprot:190728-Amphidinium_carterae.2